MSWDMAFHPEFCPYSDCAAGSAGGFRFHRRGNYRRKCDGIVVPRFQCLTCGRRFSRQAFRFNYRWWRPTAHLDLFRLFVSKVTMRQAARITGLSRQTVARRMAVMGEHCREFHRRRLKRRDLGGSFQLDEMETFETDRLVRPVTVPVLVETRAFFVVHAEVAPLPPRGRLDCFRQARKRRDELLHGRRKSGSRQAVARTLAMLADALAPGAFLDLRTDRKSTYPVLVRRTFPGRVASHVRISSKARRDRKNPLFTVNHTLAMMRDGISRLVRRSWGVSKLRQRLTGHLWIWIAYRNYVRGITVTEHRVTPAMAVGVAGAPVGPGRLFRDRWPGSSRG